MNAIDVIAILEVAEKTGIPVWVAGGWAVEAVVGRQTREHDDLDLAVDAAYVDRLIELARGQGYEVSVDERPARLEMTAAADRVLDLHPVVFATDGSGTQASDGEGVFYYSPNGFDVGSIEGVRVPCLSARQQLAFRTGYDHSEIDEHDIALLSPLVTGSD
jgi:lincosamide nucleotidyltransferase A/C/D/E